MKGKGLFPVYCTIKRDPRLFVVRNTGQAAKHNQSTAKKQKTKKNYRLWPCCLSLKYFYVMLTNPCNACKNDAKANIF